MVWSIQKFLTLVWINTITPLQKSRPRAQSGSNIITKIAFLKVKFSKQQKIQSARAKDRQLEIKMKDLWCKNPECADWRVHFWSERKGHNTKPPAWYNHRLILLSVVTTISSHGSACPTLRGIICSWFLFYFTFSLNVCYFFIFTIIIFDVRYIWQITTIRRAVQQLTNDERHAPCETLTWGPLPPLSD
jgi:Ca2+-dependent lipid-binding protein